MKYNVRYRKIAKNMYIKCSYINIIKLLLMTLLIILVTMLTSESSDNERTYKETPTVTEGPVRI